MPITGGVQAKVMALWPPKAMSLQHREVLEWVQRQGHRPGQGPLGMTLSMTSSGGGRRPLPHRSSCPDPASSPGTTTRRTRLGGTETDWRLNRKREWGFQKGRQEIINLLINSSGAGGEGAGQGRSHRSSSAGGRVLLALASPQSTPGVPKCRRKEQQAQRAVSPTQVIPCPSHLSLGPESTGGGPGDGGGRRGGGGGHIQATRPAQAG